VLGLELAALELDHHVAAQLQVIEKQVDEELVAAHVQQHLPADEGEAGTQFQQELGDVLHQRAFDLALLRLVGQAQEVEAVRVLQRFARQVGLRLGQPCSESW
jgi:hypothetical protein